ncbi:ABC transporter substrate-binding protein [Novosphingobium resinovorum]|nr:ABC transporter substrate-binding protein [Novosphingobium resinovorum]
MLFKRQALRVLAVLAASTLVSCSGYDNSALGVAVVGKPGEVFADDGVLVQSSTAEGLVAFDDAGRVIPALADRWIVTDDGQSYIFRLRDGNWADGSPITADSARRALNAALKGLAERPLALDLAGIDEIRAMTGRVIEVRLNRPMPYLLQLLAQPELGLYRKGKGTGPMEATRAGDVLTLGAIDPARLGMPPIENWAERTRQIRLRALSGAAAVGAFNDGSADLVLGGRIQDFLLTRSVGILRGTIQLDPVVGLFGLQVMNDRGFLAEPGNREALALAIDREGLMAPFGVGGWVPTTRIVTPSLDGDLGVVGERWVEQTLDERRAIAAARVRAWHGAPVAGGGQPPGTLRVSLRLWLPEGGGSTVLFNRLSADLGAIGIGLERAKEAKEADLALVDEVARYPRGAWYLNRLSCHAGTGLCSQEADERVAEAATAATPAERAALLVEAERVMTGANVFIPFGTPIRWSLVRGSVDGFAANPWGWHPLMPLAWLPK